MDDYRIHPGLLAGKKIGVGISGGISVYKVCELVRRLTKNGATVYVIMTKHATRFVSPLTFEALTGNRVIVDMWGDGFDSEITHTSLADELDLLSIVPATANIIGKAASGIADDFLSTLIVAVDIPVMFAPAMNPRMYTNAAVQANIQTLKDRDCIFAGPDLGDMACGHYGYGRLVDVDAITDLISSAVHQDGDLKGKQILITAGPTRQYLDPVRFLSNRSTGLMGYSLAAAAADRGAEVILISGPSCLKEHFTVKRIDIESAEEMASAVVDNLNHADIVIMTAAVADWTPRNIAKQKIKKNKKSHIQVELVRTQDILSEMSKNRPTGQIVMGFAAETNQILENAKKKLKEKDLDLLFVNDVNQEDRGFAADKNAGTILFKSGKRVDIQLAEKRVIADQLLDTIIDIMQ